MEQQQHPRDIFHVAEGKDGKSYWTKIGTAFVNRDGSLNAYLDLVPRDGKIQIRERKPQRKGEPS